MKQVRENLSILFSVYFAISLFVSSHDCMSIKDDLRESSNTNSKDTTDLQWSDWSGWSPCSRSCDGGISTSLRKCYSKAGCVGEDKRHKICNMQLCPSSVDFRYQQCSSFDSKPYRDRYYEWLPYIDPMDPCSLTCRASGLNFVAKLVRSVKDGTRCRPGSLDMCVAGKCLSVGCDLQVGSLKKIDECGICGGDGSTCQKYQYSWTHRFDSECSQSCGGGTQLSMVVCVNLDTQDIADDVFCDSNKRLKPESRSCANFDCPPTWVAEEWSDCDKKCATGIKTRKVFCEMVRLNGSREHLNDYECIGKKPDITMKCNEHECPQWYQGLWSNCSENCGNGIQTRHVVCRNSQGSFSDQCEMELKPTDRKNCSDISNCLQNKLNSQEDSPQISFTNEVSTEPSFIIGQWSPCNSSCGIGIKKRKVECKIFLEFSKTVLTIPEDQCPGKKPVTFEVCYSNYCNKKKQELSHQNVSENLIITTPKIVEPNYVWRISGFTKCSATCLGGTQETLIECIRLDYNKTVKSSFCDINLKPDSYTRTCNDQPCPFRWNITEFIECSKECGEGGFQTRIVRCVHEVARGSTNIVIVPDHQCQGPNPSTKQACNQVDCPAKWIVGPWTKCSKECGGGIKTRKIRCMKDYVFGGFRELEASACSAKKPRILKACNQKSCHSSTDGRNNNELSRKSKRNNNAIFDRRIPQDKVVIKVRGKAIVNEGAIVKLRCPDWNDEPLESTVTWLKDNKVILNDKKYHSFKNVLKIKNIKTTDTGVYKCSYRTDDFHSMFLHVIIKSDSSFNQSFNDYNSGPENLELKHDEQIYYKNELDLSQELDKYGFNKNGKGGVDSNFFHGRKSKADHKLSEFEDSWEVNQASKDSIDSFNLKKTNPVTNSHDMYKPNELPHDQGQPASFFSEIKFRLDLLLSQNNYKDLKFNWIITEWSRCTIPCGGIGFRMRLSQCYVNLERITQTVDNSYCIKSGLQKPNDIEKCGHFECAFWKVGEWSECDHCVDINKGLLSRSVNCMLKNGTVIEDAQCLLLKTKPPVSQSCINENCVPFWSVGKWSKCHAKCSENGFKNRTVECAWKITEKPADHQMCFGIKKPEHVAQCFNLCK